MLARLLPVCTSVCLCADTVHRDTGDVPDKLVCSMTGGGYPVPGGDPGLSSPPRPGNTPSGFRGDYAMQPAYPSGAFVPSSITAVHASMAVQVGRTLRCVPVMTLLLFFTFISAGRQCSTYRLTLLHVSTLFSIRSVRFSSFLSLRCLFCAGGCFDVCVMAMIAVVLRGVSRVVTGGFLVFIK